MCGIGGYVGPGTTVDAAAMSLALAARGPDGHGEHRAQGTSWTSVLVQRRLAIMDPTPAGAQPMLAGKTHALVLNGEIFNHAVLRTGLEREGVHFHSTGDTEVVLHGLRLHGPAFLTRMRGPFALALLDCISGDVLLARDRLGVNPLYVTRPRQGGVAFASTVQALQAAGVTEPGVDVRALCGFLFFGSVPEPLSLVPGVEALEPGTWRRVMPDGRTTSGRYWRFPAEEREGDAAGQIGLALEDAVRAELVSDVPVAVLLSSGLDSTSVAALAARAGVGRLDAFTVAFEGNAHAVDESALAGETAAALGLGHHVVRVDVEDGTQRLVEALAAQDQPSMDGVNTFLVSGAIGRAGYKVALSGLGGDELFLGYANARNFRTLASLPEHHLGAQPAGMLSHVVRKMGLGLKLERAVASSLGHGGVVGAYASVRSIMGPATLLQLLHPDLVARLRPEDLDAGSFIHAQHLPADVDGALSRLEMANYMRNTLLKDSNILSLAHGVELRVPMVDARLVETVLRVPGRVRAQGSGPKPLLRRALGNVLPQGLEKRPKVGFVLPLKDWLVRAPAVHSTVPLLAPNAPSAPFPVSMALAALQAWGSRQR